MTAAIAEWVPLRWQGGTEPSSLAFVKDSPVNCLAVNWAERERLGPLIAEARAMGLDVVGLVEGPAAARDANFAAVLPNLERSRLDRTAPVISVADGVWPGIQQKSRAEAGPTGAPWLDSNGWAVQLVRTLAPGRPVWFNFDPPKGQSPRASAYAVAIADVECRGARWPVSLDAKLRAGLTAGNAQALATWKTISDTLKFFRAHRAWGELQPVAALAIVSDFAGPNEFLSTEILNLSARRLLPFHVIEKSAAAERPFAGLRAIVYPDEGPPAEPLRKSLLAFVNDGGLLLTGPSWKFPDGTPAAAPDPHKRYNIRTLGRGRIAIPREEDQDPYLVAADVHLLMSHRYDIMRFFNAGLLGPYLTASADGRKAVLHVVNYGGDWGARDVSAALRDRFVAARMWRSDKPDAPAPVRIVPGDGGIELQLPPLGAYTAIELEKQS